nr:uncharacterized protein BN887_02188 [Melanopsichium pennsylvanicum 4]
MEWVLGLVEVLACPEPETPTPMARPSPTAVPEERACLYKLYSTPTGARCHPEPVRLPPAFGLTAESVMANSPRGTGSQPKDDDDAPWPRELKTPFHGPPRHGYVLY